jgi:rhodanese-related sulfurtransferase
VCPRTFGILLMSVVPRVSYIGAEALATMLRAQQGLPAAERGLVVLDVRDDDYAGGHIAQARHVPAGKFLADDAGGAAQAQARAVVGKETVVVHCALSQVRGPACASRLAAALEELRAPVVPRVLVLEGGFSAFARLMYRKDRTLFADFDERLHASSDWHDN